MSHRKKVRIVSPDELKRLTTRRLLAYQSQLMQVEDSLAMSDGREDEQREVGFVYFKEDVEWLAVKALVSQVLVNREHVSAKALDRFCDARNSSRTEYSHPTINMFAGFSVWKLLIDRPGAISVRKPQRTAKKRLLTVCQI